MMLRFIGRFVRRLFLTVVCLAAAAACTALLINRHVMKSSSGFIRSDDTAPEAEAILVLGASVYGNGQVSDILKDRLDTALALYQGKHAPKILVSGDHGSADYDEVGTMKRYLTDRKVPAKNIFMDHSGFSTYESMYRAKAVFDVKKVIIVTQNYHLDRAVYVARSLGMDAYGVQADKRTYRDMDKYEFREFFARNKDFIYARITKPVPDNIGDRIPISGDGTVTANP
jgi:SanA protein